MDEWTVGALDLAGYLERIGIPRAGPADATTLTALHRAHIAAIVFENLDVTLGRAVSVDLHDIQRKLVVQRRGGYCYEQNLLFAAALEQLGFTVTRLLARVGRIPTRGRTHMTLVVEIGEDQWLADVGFGTGLLEPIPLTAGVPRPQGDWLFRLGRSDPDANSDAEAEAGRWQLQEFTDDEWTTRYTVDVSERQRPADVLMSNHWTSTWPGSAFVAGPIVVTKDEREQRELRGRRLVVTTRGGAEAVRELDDSQFAVVLGELGVELTTRQIKTLVAGLPDAPADS